LIILKVGDTNCPVKFTLLNRIYCIKFEINLASSPRQTTSLPTETTTNSFAHISVESFKVFKSNPVDKPPSSWQQWFNPPVVSHDQSFPSTNGLFPIPHLF
jgi:hypothetical protein